MRVPASDSITLPQNPIDEVCECNAEGNDSRNAAIISLPIILWMYGPFLMSYRFWLCLDDKKHSRFRRVSGYAVVVVSVFSSKLTSRSSTCRPTS